MNSPRILLIIPCYNEQKSIRALLKEISDLNQGLEVLVVDDGSRDDTFVNAQSLSPTVRHIQNLGIGGAVQTGIKYAQRHGFDFCVQIDGDGQHPPGQIAKLLEAYKENPTEIIVGSRFLNNDTFRSTWYRRLGSRIIAFALNNLFSDCRVTDPTSGLRLMNRRAIQLFASYYPHDFPEPISLAWALRAKMTVQEVPVEMRARGHGQSSITGIKPVAYIFRVIGYIMLTRLSRTTLL